MELTKDAKESKLVSPFGVNPNLSDLITTLNYSPRTFLGRAPLNCKLCGSTHTLRKIEDGYLCELHFKELKKCQR